MSEHSEYTSFGSYTPIYEQQLDRLYTLEYPDQARRAIAVFRAYARHASALGTCYPSIRRVMQVCHYSETSVRRGLTILFKHDYMRAHIETSAARKRDLITMHLSPYVLHIAAPSIKDSLDLWKTGSLHCNVIFNEQPALETESETESGTRIRNQHQNQQQQQNSVPERMHIIPLNQPKQALKQAEGQTADDDAQQTKVQSKNSAERQKQTEGQSRYVPPLLVDIGLCRRPFADAEREQFAHQVKAESNTTLAQSRQMVATYGIPPLRTALQLADQARANGQMIRSRIGFARGLLDKGAITPDDTLLDREDLAGKFAAYFTS
jgi:hypothetical protein